MSAKPENTFIGSVHKHLPANLYHMKNHNMYVGGVPDVWYSAKSDLWVEYKFIVVPKRDSTEIDLITGKKPEISTLQQGWLTDRHHEGRKVGVIIGCKEGGVWFPDLSWNATYSALYFRERLSSRNELAGVICREVDYVR